MDRRLLVISFIIFINITGYGLVLPLMPFFAQKQGASPFLIGLFISTYPLFTILSGAPLGALSDKYGRKPVLLLSLIGTITGFFLLATAQNLIVLFLARIIDGISGGSTPIARAAIADISSTEHRTSKLGVTFAAESMGLIFGPLLGGVFVAKSIAYPAYIAAAIAILCFILTTLFFQETKISHSVEAVNTKKNTPDVFDVLKALRKPEIRPFLFLVFTAQFLIMMMWGTLALFGQHYFNFGGREMGYISAFAAFTGIISQTGLLKLLLRFTREKVVITLSLMIMTIGMVLLGISPSVYILLSGVACMALSVNLLMPTITGLASKVTLEHQQGNLMGTIFSVTSIGSLTGPVIANLVFSISMRGNYFFGATIALIIMTWLILNIRRQTAFFTPLE